MKVTISYYYVQCQKEDKSIEIAYHTHDKATNEYYHKFFDRKKAERLAENERKTTPNLKFRVVKCVENYTSSKWI